MAVCVISWVLVVFLLLFFFLKDDDDVSALDEQLAQTPPMGWNSWNCYKGNINDETIRQVINAMVSRERLVDGEPTSLADLGYIRLGIDDGWQACGMGPLDAYHAANGRPLVNLTKFPRHFKQLVAYGHRKQLKMGFYHINCICMDTYQLYRNQTWARLAWEQNVQQLIQAGFDGVKIDNCGDDAGRDMCLCGPPLRHQVSPFWWKIPTRARTRGLEPSPRMPRNHATLTYFVPVVTLVRISNG